MQIHVNENICIHNLKRSMVEMYPSHEEALKLISMVKLKLNIRYRTRLQQSSRSSILDIISYEFTSNEILISC